MKMSARTVYFVVIVLLLGTTHGKESTTPNAVIQNGTIITENQKPNINTVNNALETTNQKSTKPTKYCVSTPSSPKPTQEHVSHGQCILFLPNDKNLLLVLVPLAGTCLALLLITLVCACQVCHLKSIISKFKPNLHSVDRHAVRNRSEPPCRDDRQKVREPSETCFMLSEVTTQEEENKEESTQTNTVPSVKFRNGDVAQEEDKGCGVEKKEPNVRVTDD